jgi:hypothetical protein
MKVRKASAKNDAGPRRPRHCWEMSAGEQVALARRLKDPGLPEKELEAIRTTFRYAGHPLTGDAFEESLEDRRLPEASRRAAGELLRRRYAGAADDARLRRWWASGDALLRENALRRMGVVCRDVVLEVASDTGHDLHATAVGRLCEYFDGPAQQGLKVCALRHPDPAVRATAAEGIARDHPVEAEGPLLGLTDDSDPKVAAAACWSLLEYPTQLALRCLSARVDDENEKRCDAALPALSVLSGEVYAWLDACTERQLAHLRKWLEPVRPILDSVDADTGDDGEDEGPAREPARRKVSIARLLDLLEDPDGGERGLSRALRTVTWATYSRAGRRRLSAALLAHAEPTVRASAADAFLAWRSLGDLATLLGDREPAVRRKSLTSLAEMPPDPAAARLAWDHLAREGTVRGEAALALRAFARQAPLAEAVSRVSGVADDPARPDGLRAFAVSLLRGLGAVRELRRLLSWLDREPAGSWDVHVALLEAAFRLKLEGVEVGWLKGVDHLHVQRAVGLFVGG